MDAQKPAKRVAIIGAGISGLVSLKECLAEGCKADVFETRSEIGGQWAYEAAPNAKGELQSSMYDGVVMNSCRDTTAFSDFPIDPATHGDYLGHRQMHQYILAYADHFGLKEHVKLRTRVLSCTQADNGKWAVRYQDAESTNSCDVWEEATYDALIAATGVNTIPNLPAFTSRESFKGEFLHSHFYRRPGVFEGKRVVLIGIGSAAVDLACELAAASREIHVVTRRGGWVLPRYVLGKPVEAWDNRATQVWVPARAAEYIQTCLLDLVLGKHPKELQPDHRLLQQNPTIRTEFVERVRTGALKIHRAEVACFTETGLKLSDGTAVDADVVIACTGYLHAHPYLPADVLRNAETPYFGIYVYKLIVPARYENIYFVGMIEAPGPALPPMEAQARFAVGIITGRVTPPAGEALMREIRNWQELHAKQFIRSERHVATETYVPYIDSLLELLGAKPTFGRLLGRVFSSGSPLRALSTLSAVYFGLTSSAQWRLFGHGRKEELARETVLRIAGEKGEMTKRERELLTLQ
ncbi:flavin-binding monooxygenase-like family protein [Pseudomassariella vexata]|uniref:Flavin-containing monooxygenase 1 n=1 Tax=Pseudomassariella vexata TaxID=1141098 RepID=A0A1Y2D8P5_9PEZI|nr:flavin-binding monooxygenase-like family protein [Pseudomassariella vexata]ORY55628.1 flavin-binding monooxygenase-like family protein [Pseudomassariella vexata]